MSISFTIVKPTPFQPAYNEVIYHVKPTGLAGTEQNYTIVCKVFAADGTTPIATLRQLPLPDGSAVFDLHRILESFVSYDINMSTTNTFAQRPNSFKGYVCKFGDDYLTGSPLVWTGFNLRTTDTLRYVVNGIFDFPNFLPFFNDPSTSPFAANYVETGTAGKFLTNAPRVQYVRPGCYAWLHIVTPFPNNIDHALLKPYNASGGLVSWSASGDIKSNGFNNNTVDNNKFLSINTGPGNWHGLDAFISANAITSYTVELRNTTDHVSETMTYIVNNDCTAYTWYRLHFLNKLGGMDAFDFKMKSRITETIERQQYRKFNAGLSSAGDYVQNPMQRLATNFNTVSHPRLSVESDWITDAQAVWLEELVTSPQVFIELGNGQDAVSLIPVNIETTSYETKQKKNDKLINIKLDLSYTFDKYRQRG